MSLAPASSRGAFLKARLAVNGIQCAARSLGTLTAAGVGLLSSMGASSSFAGVAVGRQAISFAAGRERQGAPCFALFPLNRAVFWSGCGFRPRSQIGGGDPEHLGLSLLGVEPQQRQLRECGLQRLAAAADLAQQPALRRQMPSGLI